MDKFGSEVFWVVSVLVLNCYSLSIHRHEDQMQDFALSYLRRYGYTNCLSFISCQNDTLRLALMEFQTNFDLNATGLIDEETLEKMRTKRCGKSDRQKFNESTSSNSVVKRSVPPGMRAMNEVTEGGECSGIECLSLVEKTFEERKIELQSTEILYSAQLNKLSRRKRSTKDRQVVFWKWNSSTESRTDQETAIVLAQRLWNELLPLKFIRTNSGLAAHIEYTFKQGPFKTIVKRKGAKTEVHVQTENWVVDLSAPTLVNILSHAIGHHLSLPHIFKKDSVMNPLFENDNFMEIGRSEQEIAQKTHGKCTGKFDLVVDWLTDNATTYTSLFVRGQHCWVYSHKAKRTVTLQHPCILPPGVSAAVQFKSDDRALESFVFKGHLYYKYDDNGPKPGYPKHIREDFGCNSPDGPSLIDAAYSDTNYLYLFSGEKVWLYDKIEFPSRSCQLFVANFNEIFQGSTSESSINGSIDAMYYSIYFRKVMIFKDDSLFVIESSRDNSTSMHPRFEIKKVGQWNEVYDNICEGD